MGAATLPRRRGAATAPERSYLRSRKLTAQQWARAAWEARGHDPSIEEWVDRLIERGSLPMGGGMPTGAGGMAFVHNRPADGQYVENTDAFFKNTERNDIPLPPVAFPGFGQPLDVRVPQVGVLGGVRIVVKGTVTVSGTGAVTAGYQWPYNLAKRVSLNVNGQTSIISVEGMDLRARRQRYYRNPRDEVTTAPAIDSTQTPGTASWGKIGNPVPGTIANGTYPLVLVYDVPITHDDYNMAGALYAQSDQNNLQVRLEAAATTDLFSIAAGGAVAVSAQVYTTITTYDIPAADTQQGRRVLLPDMTWVHGFLSQNQPFQNTGEWPIALVRTQGQLLATYVYLDNGGLVPIQPLALDELRWQYAMNRRPRTFRPTEQLMEKMAHDYDGLILPGAGYVVLDNEVDNPVRDLVIPKGVTELQVVATIPVATTLNANSHAHYAEESMFVGG